MPQPTAAASSEPGNWEKASCAARMYVVVLSEKRRPAGSEEVWESEGVAAWDSRFGESAEEPEAMRYLYTCGITA